jgi:hypothetical protein
MTSWNPYTGTLVLGPRPQALAAAAILALQCTNPVVVDRAVGDNVLVDLASHTRSRGQALIVLSDSAGELPEELLRNIGRSLDPTAVLA